MAALPLAPEARALAGQLGGVVNAALEPALEDRPTMRCLLAALDHIGAGGSVDDLDEMDSYMEPPDLE